MLNKIRLWARKYLRHTIIAIAIGVFIALMGVLLIPLLNIDIRKPLTLDSVLGILAFLLVVIVVSILWFRIPLPRIQQERNPAAWISAEIESLEHDIAHDERGDFRLIVHSELAFDIHLNYLVAQVIINGNETPAIMETKSGIEVQGHTSAALNNWRLVDSPLSLYGVLIQLKLIGQDTKHRSYELVTKAFTSKPKTPEDRLG